MTIADQDTMPRVGKMKKMRDDVSGSSTITIASVQSVTTTDMTIVIRGP